MSQAGMAAGLMVDEETSPQQRTKTPTAGDDRKCWRHGGNRSEGHRDRLAKFGVLRNRLPRPGGTLQVATNGVARHVASFFQRRAERTNFRNGRPAARLALAARGATIRTDRSSKSPCPRPTRREGKKTRDYSGASGRHGDRTTPRTGQTTGNVLQPCRMRECPHVPDRMDRRSQCRHL